jgi:ATP-dependent Clp protease ATP-binding subunit ClpC
MNIPAENRLTDRSRRVFELAHDAATRLGHHCLGTQHVLLGMLREGKGVAGAIPGNIGVSADSVELKAVDDSTDWTVEDITEAAHKQAIWLKHNYIGTEHLCLGICTLSPSRASNILLQLGVQPRDVCRVVIQLIGADWDRWTLDHPM